LTPDWLLGKSRELGGNFADKESCCGVVCGAFFIHPW